jgi:hypothetical protein
MKVNGMNAAELLRNAAQVIDERGQVRDTPEGERSMARAVDAFNTLNGSREFIAFTELDGWIFMCVLKLARATAGKAHVDDFVDLAGYGALAAECLSRLLDEDVNVAFVVENAAAPYRVDGVEWTPPAVRA